MSNQECKARPEIVNINNNNPIFYPFSVKASKCSNNCNNIKLNNCNNINDPCSKICVADVVNDLNVKVII